MANLGNPNLEEWKERILSNLKNYSKSEWPEILKEIRDQYLSRKEQLLNDLEKNRFRFLELGEPEAMRASIQYQETAYKKDENFISEIISFINDLIDGKEQEIKTQNLSATEKLLILDWLIEGRKLPQPANNPQAKHIDLHSFYSELFGTSPENLKKALPAYQKLKEGNLTDNQKAQWKDKLFSIRNLFKEIHEKELEDMVQNFMKNKKIEFD